MFGNTPVFGCSEMQIFAKDYYYLETSSDLEVIPPRLCFVISEVCVLNRLY